MLKDSYTITVYRLRTSRPSAFFLCVWYVYIWCKQKSPLNALKDVVLPITSFVAITSNTICRHRSNFKLLQMVALATAGELC